MKTIEMTDEDYKTLMDLAKELRTQDHDSQANPRMWTVDTIHERVCKEGYSNPDSIKSGYSVCNSDSCTSINLEDLNEELLKSYKENGSLGNNLDEEYEAYIGNIDQFEEWCEENKLDMLDVLESNGTYSLIDYLETFDGSEIDVVPTEEYYNHELNATFFKSDAKKHIEINGHNLGKNPHTYAFTVFRMPKMEDLFDILTKLGEE